MTLKILLVGTGITTAVTGMCLRKTMPDVFLTVWDKARGIGGRMSTSRSATDDNCTVDLGAQYFTTTEETMKENSEIYDPLLKEGILEPMACKVMNMKPQKSNIKNFVTPNGSSSLVKYCIKLSDINQMSLLHQINNISKQGNKWLVKTVSGVEEKFDIVVLTMPVPQILQLEGNLKDILESKPDILNHLNSVLYCSRYALGLFYNTGDEIDTNWDVKYFTEDPIIRYVAIDNKKRQITNKTCSVVVHTTKEFGKENIESAIPEIQSNLVSVVKQRFPKWPEPKAVKCHKWRYSQVSNVYPGAPGFITISTNPILIAGGDGFIGSTFDDCVKSAKRISQEIETLLIQMNCGHSVKEEIS